MIIDLSQLPEPEVIENLDFETIYQELLGDFREAMAGEWTAEVESDPVLKLLQLAAYRELLLRARINDAARAVMLAYASGADLDQIGAGFNVQRLLIRPAQPEAVPPVEAQYESDKSLRNRIQLAFEQLSVAGPRNAYIAHALGADGRVADASATSPAPCEVLISVLGVEGNGQAPEAVLQAVRLALNAEDVRPVADRVTVRSAGIVPYQVKAQALPVSRSRGRADPCRRRGFAARLHFRPAPPGPRHPAFGPVRHPACRRRAARRTAGACGRRGPG